MITLTVPFPYVSGNHYIKTNYKKRRKYVTAQGKAYRLAVASAVRCAKIDGLPITGKVNVTIDVWPPDRRRRDKDNMEKTLFDAMTLAGVWADDSQINDKHHLAWHKPGAWASGMVRVTLEVVE